MPSIENPDDYYSTNVTGTYNLLKLSLENKVKGLYILRPHHVMEYQKIIQRKKHPKLIRNILMH